MYACLYARLTHQKIASNARSSFLAFQIKLFKKQNAATNNLLGPKYSVAGWEELIIVCTTLITTGAVVYKSFQLRCSPFYLLLI